MKSSGETLHFFSWVDRVFRRFRGSDHSYFQELESILLTS
jgi:hypothetical protein